MKTVPSFLKLSWEYISHCSLTSEPWHALYCFSLLAVIFFRHNNFIPTALLVVLSQDELGGDFCDSRIFFWDNQSKWSGMANGSLRIGTWKTRRTDKITPDPSVVRYPKWPGFDGDTGTSSVINCHSNPSLSVPTFSACSPNSMVKVTRNSSAIANEPCRCVDNCSCCAIYSTF